MLCINFRRPEDARNGWNRIACNLISNMSNLQQTINEAQITTNIVTANLSEDNSLASIIRSSKCFISLIHIKNINFEVNKSHMHIY